MTAEAMFRMYDQDHSGYLSQNEIATMIDALGFLVDSTFVGQAMAHFGTYNFQYNTGIITLEQFPGLFQHLLSLQVFDRAQEPDPEEELRERRQARAARMHVRCDVSAAAKLSLQEMDDDDDASTVFDDGQSSDNEQVAEDGDVTALQLMPEAKSLRPGSIVRSPVRVRSRILLEQEEARNGTAAQDSRIPSPRRRSPIARSPTDQGWAEIDRTAPKPVPALQYEQWSPSRQRHSQNHLVGRDRVKAAAIALETERLRTASQNGVALTLLSQQLAEMKAIRARRQTDRLAHKVTAELQSSTSTSTSPLPLSSLIDDRIARSSMPLEIAAAQKIFAPSSPTSSSFVSPPRVAHQAELQMARSKFAES
jgi:hypothetical protein